MQFCNEPAGYTKMKKTRTLLVKIMKRIKIKHE